MTTPMPPAPGATAAAAAPPSAAAVCSEPLSLGEQGARMFEDFFLTTRDRGPTTT